jgi:hypothetical protein
MPNIWLIEHFMLLMIILGKARNVNRILNEMGFLHRFLHIPKNGLIKFHIQYWQ